jgi:predicted porin
LLFPASFHALQYAYALLKFEDIKKGATMYNIKYFLQLLLLLTGLLLASCSGGGGGGETTTPATPTITAPTAVNMTVSGKSLDFTWTAGSHVDHYRISVNPDGASGFTVATGAGAIANTATSYSLEIPVHKTNWLAAQYIVESCNADDSNCVTSPNQTLALIDSVAATVYVKASNTGASDSFGWSVSLSADGNTLAVGARNEASVTTGINGNQADNTTVNSGAVYVFSRTGNTWVQQAYVKASNTGTNDYFGYSVSLSSDGNTLAVGAIGEDSAAMGVGGNQADNTAFYSGAVYVFSRTGSVWVQQAYVKASNTGSNDAFGYSVSLSSNGNTLAVGAPSEDSAATGINGNQANNTVLGSGAVYVFSRTGSAWAQQAYVKASNTGTNDYFGNSVSLSSDGNTLAVGAFGEASAATGINGNQADNTAGSSGAVYIFTRTANAWSQQAYVKASNTDKTDQFGSSVNLSADGNTLVVGASSEDSADIGIGGLQSDNSLANAGAVYLY